MLVPNIFYALCTLFKNRTKFILGVWIAVCFPLAKASLDDKTHFQQPEQPLREALIALGMSADISIVFPTHLLQGYKSPTIKGHYTAREILQLLLHNTSLQYREINPRVIAIKSLKEDKNLDASLPVVEEISVIGHSVTGSRIRRTDLQGSSPVDIITAPEIGIAGSQTLGEFLKFIPAVSGNSTSTAISNGGNGTATVTLRGLPANNTLVLLNGKRVAFGGLAGDAVDLNSISPAAVERIEILKDGASATYGSDAIAGVVNIILKTQYDGLRLEQYFGTSAQQDLETTTTNVLWGTIADKGSLLLSATVYNQNGLFSRKRNISSGADSRNRGGADLRSSATTPSRIVFTDESVVMLDKDANRQFLEGTSPSHFRAATDEDLFDFRKYTSTISPSRRQSLYVTGNYQWLDNLSSNAELSYTKTEATITLAPTPLFTGFEDIPLNVSANNIYNPFGVEFKDIRRRIVELAPRKQQNESDVYRLNFTVNGYQGNIHWDFYSHWSKTNAAHDFDNLVDGFKVQRAVGPEANCKGSAIDGCEPLNLFGPPGSITPAQLDFIRTGSQSRGSSELFNYSFNINTDLSGNSNSGLLLALGFDARRESVKISLDNRESNIGLIGGADILNPVVGSREIYETYAELQIPIVKRVFGIHSLYAELATRHSIYSDFDKSTTPKLSFRYRPISDLLIRATYSEGFRAPSLTELHKEGSLTHAFLNDPCANPDNVGVLPGCLKQSDNTRKQFLTMFGGNINLHPELSDNSTLGMVWSPNDYPGLLISLDYFRIRQKNVVDANAQFIVNQNAQGNLFNDRVIRDSNGNIAKVLATFINIGRREVRGMDLTMKYQWFQQGNNFITSLNASHLQQFRDHSDPTASTVNLVGTFTDEASEGNGAIPEWKFNTGLHWSQGDFEASYTLNYISDLEETVPQTKTQRTIHSWITHDIQLSYLLQYHKGFRFTLGADNLLDREPPFAASAFNDNFDARTHDLKGRFWYARFSQTF